MADCNNCSSYLSSEDIIRRSVKCSGGSVAFIGSNVNLLEETEAYIMAVEAEPDGFVGSKSKTNLSIKAAVDIGVFDKIAFWTQKPDFGRNFFF